MQTKEWKIETPVPRDDEIEALENRLAVATERAAHAESRATTMAEVAKRLADRIDRKTQQAYGEGFEAGVAFAVADEARRSEPRRKVVERDREGRIVAITEESAARA